MATDWYEARVKTTPDVPNFGSYSPFVDKVIACESLYLFSNVIQRHRFFNDVSQLSDARTGSNVEPVPKIMHALRRSPTRFVRDHHDPNWGAPQCRVQYEHSIPR